MTERNQPEQHNETTESTPKNNKVKKIVYAITGISDLQIIARNFRTSKKLFAERFDLVKQQSKFLAEQGKSGSLVSEESFSDVMSRSRLSVDEIINKATKFKRYWLAVMMVSSILILFTGAGTVRLIVDNGMHWNTAKPFLTLFLFTASWILAFIKCAHYEFLGWRIVNRCNSEEEKGTFSFFISDNGLRHAFNFDKAGYVRGDDEKA